MHANIHGIKMSYTDQGRGTPLLFVHGFPLSRGAWAKQAVFKRSHRVIVPDLRGHGASSTPGGTITMAHFAEDLAALLTTLKIGKAIVIGHSMGGYIALALARQFPRMLRGLVLVGTRAGADATDAAKKRRKTADKVEAGSTKGVIDAMAPKMLSATNKNAAMTKQVRALMTGASREGVSGALRGMAERPDMTRELRKIRVPTLVATGADDVLITPAESAKMAKAIKRARLEIIPNAGHLVAFEQPAAFNGVLSSWLKTR